MVRIANCAAVLLFSLLLSIRAAADPTLSTLVSFNGANGALPGRLVIDSAGNLFGSTSAGGLYNAGTVFEVAAGSASITTLANISGPYGAATPDLSLDAAGNLYGTTLTSINGPTRSGSVFVVDAATHALSTLAAFSGPSGPPPLSNISLDAAGNLYGVSRISSTQAQIYTIAAGAHQVSLLATMNLPNTAGFASSVVADRAGNVYGILAPSSDDATLFELPAGSAAPQTLVVFAPAEGSVRGLSLDAQGNIYGVTSTTSWAGDKIFKVDALTHARSTVAVIGSGIGGQVQAQFLFDANGALYGSAAVSGPPPPDEGNGALPTAGSGSIFSIAPGSAEASLVKPLYSFFNEASYFHAGLVADPSGNLYFTAKKVGIGDGFIMELSNSSFAVPEPAALPLLAICMIGALRRRRVRRR